MRFALKVWQIFSHGRMRATSNFRKCENRVSKRAIFCWRDDKVTKVPTTPIGGTRESGKWEGYIQYYYFKKGSGQPLDNRGRDKVNWGWQQHQERSQKNCFNEKFNSCARICLNFVAVICYKATLNHSGLKILRAQTPKANYCVQRRENAIPEFSRFSDLVPKLRREKKSQMGSLSHRYKE